MDECKCGETKKQLEQANADINAVYELGPGPIEQAKQIPLPKWVETRFVHVEKHNDTITKLQAEIERLEGIEFEHQGCERLRLSDNKYLLGRIDSLTKALKQIRSQCFKDCQAITIAHMVNRALENDEQ